MTSLLRNGALEPRAVTSRTGAHLVAAGITVGARDEGVHDAKMLTVRKHTTDAACDRRVIINLFPRDPIAT